MEIHKNQTKKNHCVLAKIYKVYNICTPKCDAFWNSFFPLLSIMECYKSNWWRMFYFSHPPLHSICIVITWFGNLVNVLHDYQSIEVGSSSQIVPTLVLTSSSLHGIELGFLRQKSCNQGETIYQDASCYKWCNYWRMQYPSNQRKCGGKIQQMIFDADDMWQCAGP